MNAVEVHNLRKEFVRKDGRKRTRVAALRGVTFEVARGECIAILGQNGSGKSTLVRLLSTLLLPDGGSARIFGHDVSESRAVRTTGQPRLGRGVVLQEDVRDREPRLRGAVLRADAEARRRSRSRRSSTGSASRPRAGHAMEHLSRGTQQKVALARALLTSPVLLLLDEPTTGLDPRSKLEVQDFIREVRAMHDTTILLCTHDLAEAEILAERIGILDDGELICLETADEIKERYGVETLEEAFFTATGKYVRGRVGGRGRGGEGLMTRCSRTRTPRADRAATASSSGTGTWSSATRCGRSRSSSGRSRTRCRSSSSRRPTTSRPPGRTT